MTTQQPFAENRMNIAIGNAQGSFGGVVDIPIVISGNTGFADLELEIEYDTSALKLIKITENKNVGATFTPAQSLAVTPYNMIWISEKNALLNGTLAVLTFQIISEAEGVYPICVDYYKGRDGKNIDGKDVNYDENDIPLSISYTNGTVQVGEIVSAATVKITVNGQDYQKVLVPEYETNGIILAALYDVDNILINTKLLPASTGVHMDFGFTDKAQYINIFFWRNTLSLTPVCNMESIYINPEPADSLFKLIF